MTNTTASIERELQTLAKHVEGLFAKVRMQKLPVKYELDSCVVRYQDDDVTSETAAHNRIDRRYEFLTFGENEITCIQQIDILQKRLRDVDSLQIHGSTRYMRIGSFLSSKPFLTEDKMTYATMNTLHVQVRQLKEQPKYPVIGGVIIRPATPPTPEVGEDGELIVPPITGEDGNGGEDMFPPDGSSDIVIGKDCREGEM